MSRAGVQILRRIGASVRHLARAARASGYVPALLACAMMVCLAVAAGTAAAELPTPPMRWDASAYSGDADLAAVSFWGGARGFAVGRTGTILMSRDGGASWTRSSVDATADLHDVCFDPAGGVHAVGSEGLVVSSSDGVLWQTCDTRTGAILTGVDFADPAHGWVVGANGTVLATSDGGANWSPSSAGVDPFAQLEGIDFADPLAGWAWGGSGVVYATHDGGLTWTSVLVSQDETIGAGCLISTTEGWVGGTNGLLARTLDGGATWAFRSLPSSGTVLAIGFCDALHGTLLVDEGPGGTAIVTTADGGETWDLVRVADDLASVFVADGLHAWAVGEMGAVLRTVAVDEPVMAIETAAAPSPNVSVARAMPDGTVLLGWTDVPGSSGYVVRRSVTGGPFEKLVTLDPGEPPGLCDASLTPGDVVAYVVSAQFAGTESTPGPVATAQALGRPNDPVGGTGPSGMSCTDCHVVHTTGPTGDPAASPLWCLDCHPPVQRELAGPDPSTRHDLLATDTGAELLGLSCTDCHSPHASSEATPLIDPDHPERGLASASRDFCLACHDGTLTQHVLERELALGLKTASPADVSVTWGSVGATTSMDVHGFGVGDPRLRPGTGLAAGAALQCSDCHGAHGSTNRWALSESISIGAAGRYTGLLVEPVGQDGADFRLFCGACHLLDLHPPVASGGADLTRWPIDCTVCHRHGSGL